MGQSVTVIALLVLQTGEIGKCGPIGDCYSSPCIANCNEKYDAVEVDCHHTLHYDNEPRSIPKKKKKKKKCFFLIFLFLYF